MRVNQSRLIAFRFHLCFLLTRHQTAGMLTCVRGRVGEGGRVGEEGGGSKHLFIRHPRTRTLTLSPKVHLWASLIGNTWLELPDCCILLHIYGMVISRFLRLFLSFFLLWSHSWATFLGTEKMDKAPLTFWSNDESGEVYTVASRSRFVCISCAHERRVPFSSMQKQLLTHKYSFF